MKVYIVYEKQTNIMKTINAYREIIDSVWISREVAEAKVREYTELYKGNATYRCVEHRVREADEASDSMPQKELSIERLLEGVGVYE